MSNSKLLLLLFGLFSLFGCSDMNYKAGDIYSVDNKNGEIGVVKVLVVEPGIIHLRIYKNKFESRPKYIDTKKLSLGGIGEKDGFGIGHIPLDIEAFQDWKPEKVTNEKVIEEELEGYNIWKGQ